MVSAKESSEVARFVDLGLSEQKAKETLKNVALTKFLNTVIDEVVSLGKKPSDFGTLLYYFASKLKPQIANRISPVVKYIVENKLDNSVRLDAAVEYLLAHAHDDFDAPSFEKHCGVGVVVTPEDVELAVEAAMSKHKEEVLKSRYRFNVGIVLQEVKKTLRWADFRDVKNEIDVQLLDLLGPKTEADCLLVGNKSKESSKTAGKQKPAPSSAEKPPRDDNVSLTVADMISKLQLHKPGENFTSDGYVVTPNTKKLIEEHLKVTGGKVVTRFPPEPNGILHIGHAKAININFGYANYHGGMCYLRYDDTNPEKEDMKFFVGIHDMVTWLGNKPYKITHSSDYFDQLYEYAVKLIGKGLAYVCHQKQEEIQGFNPPPSPWRDRPIQENLRLFENMRKGLFDEGEATLRMKVTLEEGKQDPVAYRIKYLPHPRSHDKWCIYPTYDYTHCLCDSIENITHSLCTKEFQSRRSSYYWLCNALDIYCPVQWEYGRLNVNYAVVSKRKIAKLIEMKIVNDWDDPRLFTLTALRRRGFPPEAINRFCAQVGVTGAQSVVDPGMLEASVRDVLNVSSPRTMVVLEPVLVEIQPPIPDVELEVADFPNDPDKGKHKIRLASNLYINGDDFKESADKGFKRLTKAQPVGLRYTPYAIKVKEVIYPSGGGSPSKIIAEAIPLSPDNKPKGFIHWVADPEPVTVRLYKNLFIHKNPEDSNEVPGGFLSDVAPETLVEMQALADKQLRVSVEKGVRTYQFERLGYFTVDPDTTSNTIVFNRTVTLKEDAGK
ncbi:unnamed protein product [Nesidiocoris tenuis]|uniref:glutamine--tRNA ligase n=1 Tax=Nesidiocoris tenuis TaxID=355587 RepID=A0A6H5GJI1_9HEMI|nr:unnamed protein product [Nesidiocoris tenuis]CAB0005351.1 unnamed protein product [Nesidiocoris tenuis]